MKKKLKDILPNPFRDIDVYPINTTKIEQLKKSIRSTDFWDNLVAREVEGKLEIAYGHHRLAALRELFDPEKEFDFIVRDLSDDEMIKIMAHENLDEWGHDSSIERETVRAIVKAFGAGKIHLPVPNKKTSENQLRFAPSFIQGIKHLDVSARHGRAHPYTSEIIANFLGNTMANDTVQRTLSALGLIEQGAIEEGQLKNLSSKKAREVVTEANKAIKQADVITDAAEVKAANAPTPILEKQIIADGKRKAKAVVKNTVKATSNALQQGQSITDAKLAGREARVAIQPEIKELPEINEAASKLSSQIMKVMASKYDPAKKLKEIIKHKKHLSPTSIDNLDRALEMVIERAEGYRSSLRK